jgi:hypothetical protein
MRRTFPWKVEALVNHRHNEVKQKHSSEVAQTIRNLAKNKETKIMNTNETVWPKTAYRCHPMLDFLSDKYTRKKNYIVL